MLVCNPSATRKGLGNTSVWEGIGLGPFPNFPTVHLGEKQTQRAPVCNMAPRLTPTWANNTLLAFRCPCYRADGIIEPMENSPHWVQNPLELEAVLFWVGPHASLSGGTKPVVPVTKVSPQEDCCSRIIQGTATNRSKAGFPSKLLTICSAGNGQPLVREFAAPPILKIFLLNSW